MPVIEIEIRNKIARQSNDVPYVCNNDDYSLAFDFDAEWDAYPLKTARFSYNGKYFEVVFSGNTCQVPVMEDTSSIDVGVYAGDLRATTPVAVLAKKSILCGDDIQHEAPPEDVYNQIMAELNEGGRWIENTKAEAVTAANEATEAKVAAIASALAAKDAASAAEADKKLASQHASSASDSQKLASEAANSATSAKIDAHNDANEAASQARKAASSAAAAADSAISAANKASAAASSAANAEASASAAAQGEVAAANAAAAAASYANIAAQASTVAESKASEAAASAAKAATSESSAANKAAEAAAFAKASAQSQSAAGVSAAAAAASAKDAAQSKSAAEASATAAADSAKAAAQSEAAAAQSAGNAAAAATEAANAVLEEAKESGEFDGPPGYSPTISIEEITGGHRVIVTDKDGNKQFDVKDGKPGGIQTVNGIEPDEDGNVEIEAGGGVVYVTVDTETKIASHTKAEIQSLVESGKSVFLLYDNNIYSLSNLNDGSFARTTTREGYSGSLWLHECKVADDGKCTFPITFTPNDAVRYNLDQNLNDYYKSTARRNIGAGTGTVKSINGVEPNAYTGDVELHADLNAAEGEAGHIFNRTHWTDEDGTVHPLEYKYLPNGVPYAGEVMLLDETDALEDTHPTYGKVWVITKAPNLTVGETYTVIYNGVPYDCVCYSGEDAGMSSGSFVMGNFSVVGGANTGEPFAMLIFPSLQIVCLDLTGATSVRIGIVEKLFQPVDYIILRSSTEGSTKQFKLTVDDSGTISASEV